MTAGVVYAILAALLLADIIRGWFDDRADARASGAAELASQRKHELAKLAKGGAE